MMFELIENALSEDIIATSYIEGRIGLDDYVK